MYFEVTEPEYEEAEALSMDPEVAVAWMFDEEVKYQTALATSYPQDAAAVAAATWLTEQRAW